MFLFYFVLGCFEISGQFVGAKNINECYHKQRNSFEYFAFKVKCFELFSLFQTLKIKQIVK